MKAAVLYQLGQAPRYADFDDPVAAQPEQLLIRVKAASVKNLDKGRASGQHYASYTQLPVVVGIDGVGVLEDGRRVYASGISGMIAEQALIDKNKYTPVPDGLDDATAAALPNAILGAALALRYRAGMKIGDSVLINGATGVTGQLAVQLAKYYGAGKVIVTGRNQESLDHLMELGADEQIFLKQEEAKIIDQVKQLNAEDLVTVVIDYLWGRPAELLLDAFKSGGGLQHSQPALRFATVGSMAGPDIRLPSALLRSSDIQLVGSGFGSIPMVMVDKMLAESLPELFLLAAEGKLKLQKVTEPLQNVEAAWNREVPPGKRLVIRI